MISTRIVLITVSLTAGFILLITLKLNLQHDSISQLRIFKAPTRETETKQEKVSSKESPSGSLNLAQCRDPYKQPGILHIPGDADTRWVPLDGTFDELQDPATAIYPAESDPSFEWSAPPQSLIDRAPSNWMRQLVGEHTKLNVTVNSINTPPSKSQMSKELSWLWGKRVLLIGDSITRQASEHFCAELGLRKRGRPGKRYTNELCHVELFNLTTFHWHLPSMYTRKNASWWWPDDMEYVQFEERLPKIHMPYKNEFLGANGRSPDLIIWHSGLWDEMAFHNHANSLRKSKELISRTRHISWEEAAFFAARLKKFIKLLHSTFGQDVPMMYMSLTTGKGIDRGDLLVIDLDRITRSIIKGFGIELFDWTRIINGHSHLYRDDVHPKRGPLTWLWENMMLSYLFRASGGVEQYGEVIQYPPADKLTAGTDGAWEECHQFSVQSFL